MLLAATIVIACTSTLPEERTAAIDPAWCWTGTRAGDHVAGCSDSKKFCDWARGMAARYASLVGITRLSRCARMVLR